MTLTFVEGQFCATHCAPYGTSRHGHDWWVRASWAAGGDARTRAALLDDELGALDHRDLNDLLGADATNEGIAAYLGETLGCVEVEIWRFERGRRFGSLWKKEES